MKNYLLSFLLLLVLAFSSCATLKPYERIYVNDPEMQMSGDNGQQFSNYVNSIREGAVAPSGTKGNGGCGCN